MPLLPQLCEQQPILLTHQATGFVNSFKSLSVCNSLGPGVLSGPFLSPGTVPYLASG
jgi:hypothetical protein